MASSRVVALVSGLLFVMVFAAGCNGGGGGTPAVNQPPTINSINPWYCSPLAAGSVGIISVEATDPDADPLEYGFSATEGNVSATESPSHPWWMFYIAPDVTADTTVTLTFMVNDGNGGQDTLTQDLIVAAPEAGNSAPTISEFTIVPNPVPSGGTATVLTTATDVDGDALYYTYSWSLFEGFVLSNSPGNATYEAPVVTAEETWLFNVIVDDGHGHYAMASENLTVQP